MEIESDQLLLLALVASAVTLLLGILVIALRTRRIVERLAEMDAMKRALQQAQREFAHNAHIFDAALPGLTGLGLHLRQIKMEQRRLAETLKAISSAMQTLARSLRRRDKTKRDRRHEIEEMVETARSLQEWRSKMTAVYSDAAHLFDSEPIRELIEGFGKEAMHAAEPADTSERSARSRQKRVPSRRQSG